MSYSPTTILQFLANRYTAVQALLALGKKNGNMITQEQLEKLKKTHQIKAQFLNYGLIKPLTEGTYQLQKPYISFFAFLHDDFDLGLPEQLAKYHYALQSLQERLYQAEAHEVPLCIESLTTEITQFITHLDQSTQALEKEVDLLRTQQKEKRDPAERIQRANYLIHVFLQPLNKILEDRPDSISRTLHELRQYAHDTYLEQKDEPTPTPYLPLYKHLLFATDKIQWHLRTLIRSLLPLLEQIRMSNQVLAGLKNLRDLYTHRQHDRYSSHLPHLIKAQRNNLYSYYREAEAQARIDELDTHHNYLFSQPQIPTLWEFNAARYKKQLQESLPVDHFYLWCYERLSEQFPPEKLTTEKLFELVNLMFTSEFHITFTPHRHELKLHDTTLNIPQIALENALS